MSTAQEASVGEAYVLSFEPMLLEKVWGGDSLVRVGKPVARGARIGESWEVSDLASTSASGAGGGAAQSVIAHGPMRGRKLADAIRSWGRAMMGDVGLASGAGFPLLIKYLDARENLSVQVHPSIAYTKQHPGAHLKTECWYILDSLPGSVIYKGVREGVTREVFEAALRTGDGSGVVGLMQSVPAVKGECHNLPSGTVHALGAGVLVAEVQTPSDTTFRVYDWGRTGRELHIEQSLACISFEPARDATRLGGGERQARLVTTGFFDVDETRVEAAHTWVVGEGAMRNAPAVLMVLAGRGVLRTSGGEESQREIPVEEGTTLLVPAALLGCVRLEAERPLTVLRAIPRG